MNPFVRKLRNGARLTEADEAALAQLARPLHRVDPRKDIVLEGRTSRALVLVVDGWAGRYKQLENGRRQIISLLLPGDLSEPFGVLPRFTDHSLGAFTPVTVAQVSPAAIREVVRTNPRIEQALWWDLLVAEATAHERIVSLGRRSASERIGHLVCELHLRLAMVGLVEGLAFQMPLTQADLADLLGLSAVHVNRSLQDLRAAGLITLRGRHLTIHDLDGLRGASLFDHAYLHVDSETDLEPAQARDPDRRGRDLP